LTQIERARHQHPELEAHLVLMHASPRDPLGCRQGVVGDVMSGDVDDLCQSDLYMAGPPGFIDYVLRELVATCVTSRFELRSDHFK
jgi:NAD(P)H-flavin reductase